MKVIREIASLFARVSFLNRGQIDESTGQRHLGYIGTVMMPMLLQAGHEVVGCDSDLYERCTYGAGGEIARISRICARTFAT